MIKVTDTFAAIEVRGEVIPATLEQKPWTGYALIYTVLKSHKLSTQY